jgi:hypothetical protein
MRSTTAWSIRTSTSSCPIPTTCAIPGTIRSSIAGSAERTRVRRAAGRRRPSPGPSSSSASPAERAAFREPAGEKGSSTSRIEIGLHKPRRRAAEGGTQGSSSGRAHASPEKRDPTSPGLPALRGSPDRYAPFRGFAFGSPPATRSGPLRGRMAQVGPPRRGGPWAYCSKSPVPRGEVVSVLEGPDLKKRGKVQAPKQGDDFGRPANAVAPSCEFTSPPACDRRPGFRLSGQPQPTLPP